MSDRNSNSNLKMSIDISIACLDILEYFVILEYRSDRNFEQQHNRQQTLLLLRALEAASSAAVVYTIAHTTKTVFYFIYR